MLIRVRFHLVVLFLLSQFGAWAQPVADFNILVPASNCNPAVYSFENASTGNNLTYRWNFGVYPGANSIFPDPSTTYLNCGTFQVKLVVTDDAGLKDSSTQSVNVRCSPNANFTTPATTGCLPHAATFSSTSIPGSGTINNYVWDFGDGNSGTGINPSHTYFVPGCKNVTLIVTNSFGCINDTTISSYVCINEPPASGFSSDVRSTCKPPFTVNYTADSNGTAPPYTYQWIFQGGVPDTSFVKQPTVVYNADGNFNTTLITTDANGCTDTALAVDYITIDSNYASFNMGLTLVCAPVSMPVLASASGTPSAWNWTVTSPATIANANVRGTSIFFPDSGSYDICVIATYPGGCTARRCSTITVQKSPTAAFGTSGLLNTCVLPAAVAFLDSSSGSNLSYSWSFPGGTPDVATSASPVISYDTCGDYSVSLIVTDGTGCTDTTVRTDFIGITCPHASYTVTPSDGCLPLTAYFNSADSASDAVAWLWDFDDPNSGAANTSTLQNPQHTFNTEGCYTVKLTTTNAQGCTATYEIQAGVCAGWRPHANFSANPPLNCASQPVYFTDSSTGTFVYTKYYWGFHHSSDSIIESVLQNPNFTYWEAGVWDITLIVSNYGCDDTITKDDYVRTMYPLASPRAIYDCNNPFTVVLDGSASPGATSYEWIILGGGIPDSATTPTVTVTYPAVGNYSVALNVENDTTGCTDLQNIVVYVNHVDASFTGGPRTGCAPLQSCFSNLSTTAMSHLWTVTDSTGAVVISDTSTSSPCFTLDDAGVYNVQLVITDSSGCIDTLYEPEYITVADPAADFISDTTNTCAPREIHFQDVSNTVGASVARWEWDFGVAGTIADTSRLQHPSYLFLRGATYPVRLTITDTLGCSSDTLKQITLTRPVASFRGGSVATCAGTRTCFAADLTTPFATYHWDYGDGTQYDTNRVCHMFTTPGVYEVELTVTDTAGCADTISDFVTNTVHVLDAQFVADTTITTCPPLAVSFSNLSAGADSNTRWSWNFGDGQVSSLPDPFHIYTAVGKYAVTLIATNPTSGCADTLIYIDYINITGPTASVAMPPTSGCVPHPTCMSAVSQSATAYTWNLGDGTVLTAGDSICYTYTRTGSFYPELILSNGNNCVFSIPVGRVDVTGMVAAFSADSLGLCLQGTVHFTDSSHGTSAVTSWNWDFGDPQSGAQNNSTLQNPAHFFGSPGAYTVTEIITSANGCVDTTTELVTVHPTPALIITMSDSTPCAPDSVRFTGDVNSPVGVISQIWNFGDPQSGAANLSTLQNPAHYYAAAGTYNIIYTAVDNNGCSNRDTAVLQVQPLPVVTFTAHDTCLNTQPVQFSSNAQGATAFLWNFGDGNTSTLPNPAHTYSDTGVFNAQLIVSSAYCSDTAGTQVEIFSLPVAAFTLPMHASCGPPAEFEITNNSTNAVSYAWDFGNGASSTIENPVVRYNTAGPFSILLTAANAHGCIDTTADVFTVHPNPVIRGIDVSPSEGCPPLAVEFTADVTDGSEYTWNYGMDSLFTSTTPSGTFIYTDTGFYSVTLYVNSGENCRDTLTLIDTVKVYGYPTADFDTFETNTLVYPYDGTVKFTNRSQGASSYVWDFGDGSTSTEEHPEHAYEYVNSYSVLLTAINEYGCIDTISHRLSVIKKALYVPNALQPNNESANELVKVWKPIGAGLLSYKAQIFDQWGTLLWESEALSEGMPAEAWDGTYNGKACPQDVYVWKIEAVFLDGEKWEGMTYKSDVGGGTKTIGSVTLMR